MNAFVVSFLTLTQSLLQKQPAGYLMGEDKLNALVNFGKKVEKEVLGDVG